MVAGTAWENGEDKYDKLAHKRLAPQPRTLRRPFFLSARWVSQTTMRVLHHIYPVDRPRTVYKALRIIDPVFCDLLAGPCRHERIAQGAARVISLLVFGLAKRPIHVAFLLMDAQGTFGV